MSTIDTPDFGNAEVNAIARLLAERGFQLSRGTYAHPCGDTLPTVLISRPSEPRWTGPWQPYDNETATSEAQCALELAGITLDRWDRDAWEFCDDKPHMDAL
jgi:hypothetical protein